MRISSWAAAIATLLPALALTGCGTSEGTRLAASPSVSASRAAPASSLPPQPASTAPTLKTSVVTGELAFSGTTLEGKPFNAAALAGKPVLLWFWAPWCSVCAAEAPDVLRAHQRHSGKLSVLGVAGLDDLDNMQPFVDRTNTGPITHLGDPTGEIWRRFKVTQQSTYVLLDAAGKVTFSGVLGGDDLRDKVAELVG